MSRLHTTPATEATGELADLFGTIKRAMGKVPNAYATIGSNAPAVLAQALQTNGMLQTKSSLGKRELEAINLAVSQESGCDYCVAAHTLAGKAAGYTLEQTRALRAGAYAEDTKIHALVQFALSLCRPAAPCPLKCWSACAALA